MGDDMYNSLAYIMAGMRRTLVHTKQSIWDIFNNFKFSLFINANKNVSDYISSNKPGNIFVHCF